MAAGRPGDGPGGERGKAAIKAIIANAAGEFDAQLASMTAKEASEAVFALASDIYPEGTPIRLPTVQLSLMHIAAHYDALEAFISLEVKGVAIDQVSAESYRPIHYAVRNGSREVALYILRRDPGLGKEIVPGLKYQTLLLAVVGGDSEIVRGIVDAGVDLDNHVLTEGRDTPIAWALNLKRTDCLVHLLRSRRHAAGGEKDYSPVMRAIARGDPRAPDSALLLIDDGFDVEHMAVVGEEVKSALSLACLGGPRFVEVVERICESGVRIDPEKKDERGAIHWACESGSMEIVRIIVGTGRVDVNRCDRLGRTGPSCAIGTFGPPEMVEMMLILFDAGFVLEGPTLSLVVDIVASHKPLADVLALMFERGLDPLATLPDGKRRVWELSRGRTTGPFRAQGDVYLKYVRPVLDREAARTAR